MSEWSIVLTAAGLALLTIAVLALWQDNWKLRKDLRTLQRENAALVRHAQAQVESRRNAGVLIIPDDIEWTMDEDGTLRNAMPIVMSQSMMMTLTEKEEEVNDGA